MKNVIVLSCLRSAVTKPCVHKMGNNFEGQVVKLRLVGFPEALLTWTCGKPVKLFRFGNKNVDVEVDANRQKNVAVIPCLHGITHRLKKVGLRWGVQVAITARNKLRSVCAKIDNRAKRRSDKQVVGCGVKNANRYVSCATGVAYSIPLSCGPNGPMHKCTLP